MSERASADLPEIPAHIDAAFNVAMALWPKAFEAGSRAVRITWSPALARFNQGELRQAFAQLAEQLDHFPTLAQLLSKLWTARAAFERQETARRLQDGSPVLDGPERAHAAVAEWYVQQMRELRERGRVEGWTTEILESAELKLAAKARRLFGDVQGLLPAPESPSRSAETLEPERGLVQLPRSR